MRSRFHHSALPALAVLGLAGLALALRLWGLTAQSLWRDEVDTLRFATRTLPEVLGMFRKPGENGPFFFLLMRPWLAAAGGSEFALRLPSALAGALAVPVVFALTRRLAGVTEALLAALLMATGPYLVWYGQEAKMYALLTVLAPLSLLLTLDAVRRGGRWRWIALYVVTSLSFYTHLLAALVVPVQALWLILERRAARTTRRPLREAAIYLACLILPYLPLVWWEAEMWLGDFETGHPFLALGDIVLVLRAAFVRGITPADAWLAYVPALLALLAGLALWSRRPGPARRRTRTLLLVWLLLPPLALYGVSLGMPIFLDRYLIWVMPAFLIILALGVAALSRLWRPLGALLLGIIVALNLTDAAAQTAVPIKSDFRAAAAYVSAQAQPGDVLVFQISYNRHVFEYYAGGRRPTVDGPYTNDGRSEAAVAAELTAGVGAAPAAWLIAAEAPMWDERGLTQAWLTAHGAPTDHAEFTGVAVTRYRLRE